MQDAFAMKLLEVVRGLNAQDFAKERDLSSALRQQMGGQCERRYPHGTYAGICDLVIPSSQDRCRWIEVKYAQTYFSQRDWRRDNRNLFTKHVFTGANSVRHDLLMKLPTLLSQPRVSHIGMLVVFLYSDLFPLRPDTIAEIRKAANLGSWNEYSLPEWQNPNHVETRAACAPSIGSGRGSTRITRLRQRG
jgi:hypothetical protein